MDKTSTQVLSSTMNAPAIARSGLSLWEIYQNWGDGREIYGMDLAIEYGTWDLELTMSRISFLLASSYAYARRYWVSGNWYRVPFSLEYYPGLDGNEMGIADCDGQGIALHLYGGQIVEIDYRNFEKSI